MKPTQTTLIDLPINATWNQTATSVAGDGLTLVDNAHLNQPKGIDLYSNGALLIAAVCYIFGCCPETYN